MLSITRKEFKKIIELKAASGCPALTGAEVQGQASDTHIRCEGSDSPACKRCDICHKSVPIR
jgi:hypothetical protein